MSQSEAAEFADLAATFDRVKVRNERDYAITASTGIDEGRYVEIGGIEQWITIRGEDRNNPVVLFLYGGPGDATNPWGYAAFPSWLDRFTVVQWDQRGAARTLARNGPASADSLSLERMVQDGVELAEYLREHLDKDKLILVGHSFGSILGVKMAKARPELFSVYVGTAQVADPQGNYAAAYDALLAKARSERNLRAIAELEDIGPPPYPDGRGFGVQRRWSNSFEGADRFIASMLGLALGAPGYSIGDINDWLEGQQLSAEKLIPQTFEIDADELGGEFALPVLVIQGEEDFTTPTSLARSFISSIQAPQKGFVSIDGGGHFAVFVESDAFLDALVEHVLPLTSPR